MCGKMLLMRIVFPWFGMIWVAVLSLATVSMAEQRYENFDHDPGWDGHNNRSTAMPVKTVVQEFGYRASEHPSKSLGKVGGVISPDGKPAYYAQVISLKTFQDPVSASGTLFVNKGAGNTLLGFFNHNTINEWRTPNSIVLRINGRGGIFHVHVEYASSRWRAGASVIGRVDRVADRVYPTEVPSQGVHTWSMAYDPNGNNGGGCIQVAFDGETTVCNLESGHKADGATFDRFGILNVVKSVDSPGEIWIDDVVINGKPQSFDTDPGWEGLRNCATYQSDDVRPRFNFGYSATKHAGGGAAGEIGGLFFRGDCRYLERLAYYGDRLGALTLKGPLRASGKVVLLRAVSDSTTLFGFFHSEHSVHVNESQASAAPKDFLGLCIEGPSRDGFYVYPSYRVHGAEEGSGSREDPPHILPDGTVHTWTLEYDPSGAEEPGKIRLTLDNGCVELPFPREHKAIGAQFNRFGFVTPWIDGNGQRVYFDDLEYTCGQ